MGVTATILAAADVAQSASHPMDGINLLPLLQKNAKRVERTFFWTAPNNGTNARAMRQGRWKYVAETPVFPGMLFDAEADPGERKELGAKHPDVLKRLRDLHAAWELSIRPAAKK